MAGYGIFLWLTIIGFLHHKSSESIFCYLNFAVHFPCNMTFCGETSNFAALNLKGAGQNSSTWPPNFHPILQGCGPLWPWPLLSPQRRPRKEVSDSCHVELEVRFLKIYFRCDNAWPWLSDLLSFTGYFCEAKATERLSLKMRHAARVWVVE